ncbi:hypothetical protein D3C73_1431830 [compost metagenome]
MIDQTVLKRKQQPAIDEITLVNYILAITNKGDTATPNILCMSDELGAVLQLNR